MDKKWILAAAITASLAACGGGGGGGSSSSGASVGGGVSKGIVIGGVVNAYGFDGGVLDKSSPVAEPTVTGDDGSYSLTINRGYSGPVLIEITAGDGTTMRCDLAVCERDSEGTPTVVFGDSYEPSSAFKMSALVPTASGEVSASVTPLTSAAAGLAQKRVLSGADPSAAALAANAQIANKFGLTSNDLLAQPVLDITNPEALSGASQEVLEYNLKAAAAVAAALDEGESVEDALAQFAGQYEEQGIADREDVNTPSVTIAEILAAAQGLLDKIDELEGVSNEAIGEARTEINTEKSTAETQGSTQPSQGEVPDDLGAEGLQAAKAFVNQLRNVATAAILDEQQQGIDSFSGKVEQAATLVGEDQELVFGATAAALAAIAEAFDVVQSGDEYSSPFMASNEVEVAIAEDGERTVYTVDTVLKGVEVTITASDNSSIEETYESSESDPEAEPMMAQIEADSFTESETFDATADLAISGTASSPALTFTIGDGSLLKGTLVGEWTNEETWSEGEEGYSSSGEYTDDFTLSNLEAVIQGSLQADNAESEFEAVTFSGEIVLGVEEYDYSESETYGDSDTPAGYSGGWENNSTTTLNNFSLDLSGALATAGGDEVALTLSLLADGFVENCTDTGEYGYNPEDGYYDNYSYDCSVEESASDYASVSFSLAFNLDLAGIGEAARLSATASRTGLETADLDITLSYSPAQSLTFSHSADFSDDAEAPVLTVTNQNDVVMTLTELEDGDISGDISVDGEAFATIDEDAGAPVVTFTDGTFESL